MSRKKKSRKRMANPARISVHHAGAGAKAPGVETPPGAEPLPPFVQAKGRVLDLIDRGRHREAVETAKQCHAQVKSPESESLLVDAYIARMRGMLDKNMTQEALALADLVQQRFPNSRPRLAVMRNSAAARSGVLDGWVAPLANPGIAAEERRDIEDALRRELSDLRALADCAALPPGHALRQEAAVLAAAFDAVCAGPVPDDTARIMDRDTGVVLESIPKRSPLAPWKMLVRAIAHFYRHDDDACRKCVEAIPADSGPARLVPVLRAMMDGKPAATVCPGLTNCALTQKQKDLYDVVTGKIDTLRGILERLDKDLFDFRPAGVFSNARKAVAECERVWPEFAERLRQHLSVLLGFHDAPIGMVREVIGGPSRKNAYFWRLMARAEEQEGKTPMACAYWEEFHLHALHEKWFLPESEEEAQVYLRMAGLLGTWRGKPKDQTHSIARFTRTYRGLDPYYNDQPPDIRAAVAGRSGTREPRVFLSYEELYRRACKGDPSPSNFRDWLEHAERVTGKGFAEDVAQAWHFARPDDVAPLLYLVESTEKRNALKKAMGYLARVEQIDALNPDVRRARLRLLVATAKRHARDRRPHLLDKDIAEIEGLPQASELDRPAFVSGLKWVLAKLTEGATAPVCWSIIRAEATANAFLEETRRRIGSELAAHILLGAVADACRLDVPPGRAGSFLSGMTNESVVEAVARTMTLAEDVVLNTALAADVRARVMAGLSDVTLKANPAHLLTLAEAALRSYDDPLAYAASGAGLAQGGDLEARFLFLRAGSMNFSAPDRTEKCMLAAASLARTRRDMRLVDEIVEYLHRYPGLVTLEEFATGKGASDMSQTEIAEVIQSEKCMRSEATRVDSRHDPEAAFAFGSRSRGRPRFSFSDEETDEEFDEEFDEDRKDGSFDQLDLFPDLQDGADGEIPDLFASGSPDPATAQLLAAFLHAALVCPDPGMLEDADMLRDLYPELAAEMESALVNYVKVHGKAPDPGLLDPLLDKLSGSLRRGSRGKKKNKKRRE